MTRKSSSDLSSISEAIWVQYAWLVPWKPNRRTPHFSYHSYGRA